MGMSPIPVIVVEQGGLPVQGIGGGGAASNLGLFSGGTFSTLSLNPGSQIISFNPPVGRIFLDSASASSINGISPPLVSSAPADGYGLLLINQGPAAVTLVAFNDTVEANEQIAFAASLTLLQFQSSILVYNTALSQWQIAQ